MLTVDQYGKQLTRCLDAVNIEKNLRNYGRMASIRGLKSVIISKGGHHLSVIA